MIQPLKKKQISLNHLKYCSLNVSHINNRMKSFEDVLSNEKYEDNQSMITHSHLDHLFLDQLNLSNNRNIEETFIKEDENKTSNLPYYHDDIDREKSESILRLINRPGCFLIRKHENSSSLIESPYVLSIIGPSFKIFHYLLYRINQRLFIKPFSDEFYHSVKHLVDVHRQNAGVLPCTLVEYPIRINSDIDNCPSSSSTISSSSSLSSLIIQTNQLVRQQIIGKGHFGIVYKGLYNGNIPVAIKTFARSCVLTIDECESNLLSEGQTMKHLSHPYLVHLYGLSRCDNRLCLVTEYIPNGCLLFWLHQQQESSGTYLLRRRLGNFSLQICDAMTYLESKSIIHRDLAARNCLIDDDANLVKVSDFGMARLVSSSMIYKGRCSTPFPLRWSSPEVLLYREYSSKSDVWSYGILLWEIYSLGQIPFGEFISNDLAAQLIKSGRMPSKPSLANQLIYRQVISPCWTYKPSDRPSFSVLKEILNKTLTVSPRPRSLH